MSGTNRLLNNENAKSDGSAEELASKLENANECAEEISN